MKSNPNDTPQLSLRERFWKSWFPPAAVVGGMATLVGAGLRVRPAPRAAALASGRVAPTAPAPPTQPVPGLDWEYASSGVIGGSQAAPPFRRSLGGLAVDAGDQVYALGDGEVRVFGSDGRLVRRWTVEEMAQCLSVGPDGCVYVAGTGRVDIYDSTGKRTGGFAVGDAGKPPSLTAIKVVQQDILLANASARMIWRVDASGRQLGRIGDQNKTKSFILPNGHLDFVVDAAGVVRATDTGRHQVTAWALDGTPVGKFGKFGMSDPADFVGCCNPVNLAVTPDGKIVTAEKMIARVKVYEPDGRLLAFIGPEHFDQMCTQVYLAVDSKGRIVTADPVRRTMTVFSRVVAAGAAPEKRPRG